MRVGVPAWVCLRGCACADAAQGVEPARLDAPESQESSSHVPTAACPVEAGKAVKATACAGAAVQEAIVVDDDSQRSPTVDASRGSTSASTTSSQLVVDLTLDNGDAADDDCVVVCESATSFRKVCAVLLGTFFQCTVLAHFSTLRLFSTLVGC